MNGCGGGGGAAATIGAGAGNCIAGWAYGVIWWLIAYELYVVENGKTKPNASDTAIAKTMNI